ncbi:MAG: glycosyltransferase family 2 protein [Hyphomonadaceae bacterium]|nr:glycosyltransferase family 2 protein [Hyphomonadaceae bacterium]
MAGLAHQGRFRGPWMTRMLAALDRWPPFRPWALTAQENGYTASPPQGDFPAGVYQIRFRRSATASDVLRPLLVLDGDDTQAVPLPPVDERRTTYFFSARRRTRSLTIVGVHAESLDAVLVRRVGAARLAAAIAARPDAPRRRALRALASGDAQRAIDLIATGTEASTAEYHAWLQRFEPAPTADDERIAAYFGDGRGAPTFTVVMTAYNSDPATLEAAVESVVGQRYRHWRLVAVDDGSPTDAPAAMLERWAGEDDRITVRRLSQNKGIAGATNAGLADAAGEWIAFLDHDDMLAPDALALVAAAICARPDARIVYTDEDKIDAVGRRSDPYFKPGWNRELFYAQNYLNHLTVIRRDLIEAAGGLRPDFDGSQDYDLLLRCIEQVSDDAIVHVPFVAYHWRFTDARANYSMTHGARARLAALRALDDHFSRTGVDAQATPVSDTPYWRAQWRAPTPLVSLIIPTRDRLDLVRQAVDSIQAARGAYPDFEILIADNESADPATLATFRAWEAAGTARIIAAPGPFNFSRINNIAAEAARGEILGFVNNDVKVRTPEWLAEMTSHFARADVAAVGAKLLYGDGRVQHAGVVTGIGGVAGHVWKRRDGAERGPFSHLVLPREVSAVTAACMLVRSGAFRDVGGFDEDQLAVAFNDVDLCLRLRAKGWRIVWTPFAVLDHFESASRGVESGARKARFDAEFAAMTTRWGATLAADPYYNPNLTLDDEGGGLAFPPRALRPWSAGETRD